MVGLVCSWGPYVDEYEQDDTRKKKRKIFGAAENL